MVLSLDSKRFYKDWRESYRWPLENNRIASEQRILDIRRKTLNALNEKDVRRLRKVLIEIHGWKTGEQRGVTRKYENSLMENEELLRYLFNTLPLREALTSALFTDFLEVLKIPYSNLPIASAQASFLLDRKTPILDRFVAQFFSMRVSPQILGLRNYNMESIFRDIRLIPFEIEDDGRNICVPRLAVYYGSGYRRNRDLFVRDLLPELQRIAQALNAEGIRYKGIDGIEHQFSQVDVEMAVFAFGTQNRKYFECFYIGREIPFLDITR